MDLSSSLKEKYTKENLSASQAQRLAEFIAWGPVVFQVGRLMVKFGILSHIRESENGLTRQELVSLTNLSDYAVKSLTEAALSIGLILVDPQTERFTLSKCGWFLLNDPATRINLNFNHDVNYLGWFKLEESLLNGKPEGLKYLSDCDTIYEALSSLPSNIQKSWLDFDHFYSDSAFPEALRILFDDYNRKYILDIGGNTGKWALKCVDYKEDIKVVVLDLPQQIEMMKRNIDGKSGYERIDGVGINILNENAQIPFINGVDGVWMSQFLDCFSMEQIVTILQKIKNAISSNARLFIMETLWDRQRFEPATFCLTMTSLYFTALANGNSKMYNTHDMEFCIRQAGFEIEKIYDNLGQGHSVLVCRAVK